MSLIQEALKRKQEDAEHQAGKHPSLEYKGAGSGTSHNNMTMLGIILGVGFFFVVVLLLVLLVRSGPAQIDPVVVASQPAPVPVIPEPPSAPVPEPSVPVTAPELVSAPVKEEGVATLPAAVVSQPAAPVVVEPEPEIVPVVVVPEPEPIPEPPSAPVWPKMRVMGVLTNPDADFDSAIVNGRIRDPGEVVDGVKIISVDNKGALLGFMGETQYVKVGRSYPE